MNQSIIAVHLSQLAERRLATPLMISTDVEELEGYLESAWSIILCRKYDWLTLEVSPASAAGWSGIFLQLRHDAGVPALEVEQLNREIVESFGLLRSFFLNTVRNIDNDETLKDTRPMAAYGYY